jgi:hypothetical protein
LIVDGIGLAAAIVSLHAMNRLERMRAVVQHSSGPHSLRERAERREPEDEGGHADKGERDHLGVERRHRRDQPERGDDERDRALAVRAAPRRAA